VVLNRPSPPVGLYEVAQCQLYIYMNQKLDKVVLNRSSPSAGLYEVTQGQLYIYVNQKLDTNGSKSSQ
jgi:uncharacterized protein YbbK (DUF523 family)